MQSVTWKAVLSLASFITVGSAAAAEISISIEPQETLPHVPVSIHVQFSNPSSEIVRVPSKAVLQVSRDGERPHIALATSRRTDRYVVLLDDTPSGFELGPGERRDIDIYAALTAPWACDPVLLAPGISEIQLIVSDELQNEMTPRGATDAIHDLGLQSFLASNKVNLNVVSPTGVDAEVFALIREEPCEWPDAYARTIWKSFPTSTYAAFAVAFPQEATVQEQIDALRMTLSKNPPTVFANRFEYAVAQLELQKALGIKTGKIGLKDAQTAARAAESILRRLGTSALDPSMRDAANRLLGEVPSEQELKRQAAISAGEEVDVRPLADCRDESEGIVRIWFGYLNPNRKTVTLPIGSRNQLTPAPAEDRQPTEFKPGDWYRVFSTEVTTPEITWHLDKTNLVVKPRELKTCTELDSEL